MRNLSLKVKNTTEKLVLIGKALGEDNINIEGLCVFCCGDANVVNLLVGDAIAARKVLINIGLDIDEENEVIVFNKNERQIVGKPGSFGEICQKLLDAGVNIKFGYPAENNRFVFGVDDIQKARDILL